MNGMKKKGESPIFPSGCLKLDGVVVACTHALVQIDRKIGRFCGEVVSREF